MIHKVSTYKISYFYMSRTRAVLADSTKLQTIFISRILILRNLIDFYYIQDTIDGKTREINLYKS